MGFVGEIKDNKCEVITCGLSQGGPCICIRMRAGVTHILTSNQIKCDAFINNSQNQHFFLSVDTQHPYFTIDLSNISIFLIDR